jgi:hypothetical protein
MQHRRVYRGDNGSGSEHQRLLHRRQRTGMGHVLRPGDLPIAGRQSAFGIDGELGALVARRQWFDCDYTIAGTFANNLHGTLKTAAARGITVFMAIGDWGSENDVGDGKCHISYPNGDPFVTACGGTILGSANPTPPGALYEYTWSDGNVLASPFQGWSNGFYYEATGGGVSESISAASVSGPRGDSADLKK